MPWTCTRDDGWTEWFFSWPQYLQGSAVHEAVQGGPVSRGSTFVAPSSLPASTAPPSWSTCPPRPATCPASTSANTVSSVTRNGAAAAAHGRSPGHTNATLGHA